MKKNTKIFLSLLTFSFLSVNMSGQERHKQELTPSGHIRCYTVENEEFLKAKYPNRATIQEFEQWLAPQIAKIKADKAAGKNVQAVYNIPVVIHIVHDGDCIGTGENITDAQAISQITVMNQDFRRMAGSPGGANTTGLAVDCEINFVLAKRDPNGNPTTGVIRHQITPYSNNVADGTGGPDWETNADVQTMKTNTIWDPTKYLNMWTIRPGGLSLQNGGLNGLLGYAQFPDPTGTGVSGLSASQAANTDGVVAGFDVMGTNGLNDGTFILNPSYNLGRTMTHEVGHWLGLRHIWGDNALCPATNSSDDKDYCADTPAANAANYTCDLNKDSCPSTPGNDMVQNYMDYTNDACMDTFTADQKARMQAIMAGAARRNSLNLSNVGIAPSAGIYFNKGVNYCSVIEGTNCSYTDVNYLVSIIKAPTANAVVTFNVNGATTATNNLDFQIITPTVTFNSGSSASQILTIRYFNDGLAESNETLVLNMVLNAGGGDATIISGGDTDTLTISIVDNDFAPTVTQPTTILSSNFSTTGGWTVLDGDGDGRNWGTLNTALNGYGSAPNTISGNCRYSEKNLSYLGGTGSATPNNFLISPQITIPAGATNVSLSYIVGGYHTSSTGSAGQYAAYFTTNPSSVANITGGTQLQALSTVSNGSTVLRTNNLNALAGQTGYVVFRHNNSNSATGLLLLDSVVLTATVNTEVQTAVNTATQYQASIPSSGIIYSKDALTGKLIVDITNTTNFNYGCTTVAVTRDQTSAGAAAVNYGSNTANNLKVMAKTVSVTPATNNAGNATMKFYFSEAEIAAWETATSNSRTALRVLKQGDALTLSTTLGTFGSNTTLSANVANGIGGVYYFGVQNTLSNSNFEFEDFSLYPNPNKGEFTVKFISSTGSDIKVVTNDLRGRKVYEKSFTNTGTINQSVSLNNVEPGIYLVSIIDGDKKTVKRIVVE